MALPFALTRYAYAHRGLWTEGGLPENSLGAFKAAAEAGLGIEFDLRPSADGEVMAFHDLVLGRMTGENAHVEACGAAALKALKLAGTDETVPSFEDLLSLWRPELPLLAEMKIDGATDPGAFAARVATMLADWPGLAAAMSFSEAAVRALPEAMMRGQLIAPVFHSGEANFRAVASRALADGISYLAVHHTDLAMAAELVGGADVPVAAWTVRSAAELEAALPYRPALIFENFDPALALRATAP
ncbi:glycerophosphodiester phosphodiesterase family protein [Hyphomonas sp.]|uniref:glycerophosphodiester phosphodiesterase family protein n=1 Tax=Hyphomonas sp. TaxID=87 RepID=UPI003918811D